MKKIVVILLGLVLLGLGIFVVLNRKGEGNEYARYLPQDVVATLNLIHLGELTDDFASTALGQFLAKDTMHAVLQEMGGTASDLDEYDQVFDGVAGVMTNPAFRAVFGEDAAVALLVPDGESLRTRPVETLRGSLVVVARTTVAGALDLFGRMGKEVGITREVVDGLELTRVVFKPDQVFYGYVEGTMVFLAYSPAAIKACLAAAEKEGRRLADTGAFQQAVAYWQAVPREKTFSRLFVNPPVLARLLDTSDNAECKRSAAMLQGIDALYSMACATDQGMASQARSTYRYEGLHPLVRSAVDATTSPNPTLFLLNGKTLAYNWASSLRPEILSQTLAGKQLDTREIETAVQQVLGVTLDELGRAFGPQYGGVLDDVVRAALFPVPKMTFFVSLRDHDVAEKVVNALREKIAENGMVTEEQEQVAGHTVFCWPLLPDKDAQPALAMTDSMLYLATSKKSLKEVLESTAKGDTLAPPVASQLGNPLAEQVSRANTGTLVLYPQRFATRIGDSLEWLAGILATTRNISISRFNQEVVRLMQSTEVIVFTSGMDRNQADWSMTLRRAATQPGESAVRR